LRVQPGLILTAEQIVFIITVSHVTACTIVLDFLADAIGYQPRENRLDQITTVFETAQGLKIALARIGSFLLEVAYAGA
jgi:hypothetical protein